MCWVTGWVGVRIHATVHSFCWIVNLRSISHCHALVSILVIDQPVLLPGPLSPLCRPAYHIVNEYFSPRPNSLSRLSAQKRTCRGFTFDLSIHAFFTCCWTNPILLLGYVSKWLKIPPNVHWAQAPLQNSNGRPTPALGLKRGGLESIRNFRPISWKRYKIGSWLPWNVSRKARPTYKIDLFVTV